VGFEKLPKVERNDLISVIIPARNEEYYISECINSILKECEDDLSVQIIVVNNRSTDDTAGVARSLGAEVIEKQEGTVGSLRNYGFQHSDGNILVFLDADCVIQKGWVVSVSNRVKTNPSEILGYRMIIPPDSNWVGRCWDILFQRRNVTGEVDWIPSGNMAMSRSAFESVLGFDENLETNEDYDICFRLRSMGYKIVSCHRPLVVHLRPPRSIVQIFKKELWHGKEVFKVFLADLKKAPGFNLVRKKNGRVILYASCYLMFLMNILISLPIAVIKWSVFPILFALLLPVVTSAIVAFKYINSLKYPVLLLEMSVLLMVYGFSRAISLIRFERIKK
jgi:glycosyltransferase involved in cell wall biosynthesis